VIDNDACSTENSRIKRPTVGSGSTGGVLFRATVVPLRRRAYACSNLPRLSVRPAPRNGGVFLFLHEV
jgi:hypothetical protein